MGIVRAFTVVLLLGVVVLAHFSLVKQAEWNGSFDFDTIFSYSGHLLPGTAIPINLPKTGIAPVDNYLAFMMAFFWTALDPKNVRARLQGNHLMGTLSSTWFLMLLEAHRGRPTTSLVVLTYFFEMLGELLGIGLFTPVWCVAHLLLTSTPKKTTKSVAAESIFAPKLHIQALGYSIILGHILPTILMLSLQPHWTGIYSQQVWTIVRLFHPVLVFFWWKFLGILEYTNPSDTVPTDEPEERRISSTRKIYLFSILASGLFHLTSIGFLTAPYLFAGWLRKNVVVALNLWDILIPYAYWTPGPHKIVGWNEGVATFLQWDDLCASTAVVIWAASQYVEVAFLHNNALTGSKFNTVFQTVFVGFLAGPAAAAAFLMQERDSTYLAYSEDDVKKVQ